MEFKNSKYQIETPNLVMAVESGRRVQICMQIGVSSAVEAVFSQMKGVSVIDFENKNLL